jgi:hypothetical protein
MMDLRYHLASLMSVFLALAVGIVVGVSLGGSERQAATIQRVQQDVAAIRAEDSRLKEVNAELRRLLAARDEAQQALLPLAVRGRLAGNRVALLIVGEAAALSAPVLRALRLAGAEVVLTARLARGEGLQRTSAGDSQGTTSGSHASGNSSLPSAGSPGDAERIASTLTHALVEGRPALLESVRDQVPDLQGSGDLHLPVRRLLILCPNDSPDYAREVAAGRGVEAAVGRLARDADAILVAAEPEEGRVSLSMTGNPPREPVSLLPTLAALGAATVDDVDTASGQIAAILALAGARDAYGTGPSATRVLPALE